MEATDHFWQAVLMQARSNNVSEVSSQRFLQTPFRSGHRPAEPIVLPPCAQDRLRKLQSAHIMRSLAARTSFSTAAGVVVRCHSRTLS